MKTGIAVFAHGSSVESANEAVREVTQTVAKSGGFSLVSACFLEGGQPNLETAVAEMVQEGAERILVVPYFLTVGLHLKRDLPELITRIREQRPTLDIRVTEPLDGHPALGTILLERARRGEAAWGS